MSALERFRVKALNRIAKKGLDLFDDKYLIDPGEKDPEAIIARSALVDTDDYPSLLAVARAGAGVNNITVESATERGICVFNTPGANANAVAELVFTMLGIAARNIHEAFAFCRDLIGHSDTEISEQVEKRKVQFRGFELAGKTLGVLGLGKIGMKVANGGILRRMRVIGFDPLPAFENIHGLSPEVILARSIGDVVHHSNILTLHMPFNEKNKGLVNEQFIRHLPLGAILVNYARGPIIDEQAVIDALNRGHLSSYLTDFPSDALLRHPKVITSPHLGASTEESEEQCASMAAKQLKAYLEYGIITNSVNFPTAESIPQDTVHTRFIMINRDIPDMIGFASHTIGSHGINIASYLNESNGTVGYNIIDIADEIPTSVIEEIGNHHGVIRTRVIRFS
ncbi:MAG: 3-phosphoglycerate dehydrogenase family protein [Thermodesulfobacteriota bacterium]|nr:3-phosphoglycerate dehydrogenase family protein [Thermodesulfobacteriota bacterium]